jgi:hypothetical protein
MFLSRWSMFGPFDIRGYLTENRSNRHGGGRPRVVTGVEGIVPSICAYGRFLSATFGPWLYRQVQTGQNRIRMGFGTALLVFDPQ